MFVFFIFAVSCLSLLTVILTSYYCNGINTRIIKRYNVQFTPLVNFTKENFVNQRIWIIGTSGAGKSTLGRMLSHLLNVDLLPMDQVRFQKDGGWKYNPDEDIASTITTFIQQESWIMEGTAFGVERRLNRSLFINEKVTRIIFLDPPLTTLTVRILKRSIMRCWLKSKLFNTENVETFRGVFQFWKKDSILNWLFTSYQGEIKKYCTVMQECGNSNTLMVFRVTSESELNSLLSSFSSEVGLAELTKLRSHKN